MMGLLFLALILAVINTIAALQYVPMEASLFHLRDDYRKLNEANDHTLHEVVFSVKQQNLAQLESLFYEVSDPKSAKYGHFLTRQQVADLTANTAATAKITSFLQSHGVQDVKTAPYGEYIKATAPVATWKHLLDTDFYNFQHVSNAHKPLIRALHYSLPADLLPLVDAVFNTIHFPAREAQRMPAVLKKAAVNASTGSITPSLLNSFYHIDNNQGNDLASQSLFESLGQYYSPADLSQFETTFNIPPEKVAQFIGGYESDQECIDDANNCAEANLDVQYIIAVAQNIPTTYWYEDATDSFLAWIQAVAASANPPLVHSISYGAIEPELPKAVANAFNTEAMKLGVQGVSILVSSGDDGVANFQARSNPKKCGYNPSFPASSPYVTAIGATQGPESGSTEIACTSDAGGVITTGGGFSTIFSAPSYQTATVKDYFASLPANQQPVSGYATTGRGYPDVAMAGFNYEVIIGGQQYMLSGTSASAPVVAGMVSLVNAARLKAGKKALGFLNTAIYQNNGAFANDITSGENNCCAGSGQQVCCTQGFYANKGWDPLTGFGSVDFQKFYNTFYNL